MNYTDTDIQRGIEALTPKPTGRESLVLDAPRLSEVVRYLLHYGYVHSTADKMGWVQSVRKAQKALGLVVDGIPGIVTRKAILMTPRCARPDYLPVASGRNQWAKGKATGRGLTWHIERYVNNIRQDVQEEEAEKAFADWSAVCGIKFKRLRSTQADILIRASDRGELGEPGNTLAMAELPRGDNHTRQLELWMDLAERWIVDLSQSSRGIEYRRVLEHELGHIMGMGHTDTPDQLMNAIYSTKVGKPQPEWDIVQAVRRYDGPDGSVKPPDSQGWFCRLVCSACKNFCGGCQ